MRAKIFIYSVIFSLVCFSCGTTKAEIVDTPETTFVNTTWSEDGGIFTTCVFSEIQSVGKMAMAGPDGFSVFEKLSKTGGERIDSSAFEYDETTCEVKLKSDADKSPNNAFHIRGVYQNPPVFVLHGNTCPDPLVLLEGKLLKAGVDYAFDVSSSRIEFKDKIDIDKTSFSVYWLTKKRECAFGNDYAKFGTEYDRLHSEWIKRYE